MQGTSTDALVEGYKVSLQAHIPSMHVALLWEMDDALSYHEEVFRTCVAL